MFAISCNFKNTPHESTKISKAKWYYYSFANELTAYDRSQKEVTPIECDVELRGIKAISPDTTAIYFQPYFHDTLNVCSLKPLGLVGIIVIRDSLYLPIYHQMITDQQTDASNFENMKRYEDQLILTIVKNSNIINDWLYEEGKRRKVLPTRNPTNMK